MFITRPRPTNKISDQFTPFANKPLFTPEIIELLEFLRARNIKRAEFLKSLYPDVAHGRRTLDWNKPQTLREIEAHIAAIHLRPSVLESIGIPVYDLLLLKALDATASLQNVVNAICQALDRDSVHDSFVRDLVRALQFIEDLMPSIEIHKNPTFSSEFSKPLQLIEKEEQEAVAFIDAWASGKRPRIVDDLTPFA